jgi:hypothetical protein
MTFSTPSLRIAAACALCAGLLSSAIAAPVATNPPPVLENGYRVDWVQVSTSPHSVGDALNALNGAGGFTIVNQVTQYMDFVNLQDAAVPFAGADPLFAVRVSGFITLGAGSYSFLSFHDDGIRIRVGGETVVLFDADTANIGTDSPFYALDAGVYEYEAISWEQGGVFNLQLGIDNGNGRFFLAGQHDVPEPASLGLAGLALIGLAGSRWRRKAAA